MHKQIALGGTIYFHFGANDTGGSATDGASPLYDVRLCGAAADAAPVLSGSGTLLSNAAYPDGSHEIAIAATSGNGFAAGSDYVVYATLTADSETPAGPIGSFTVQATSAVVLPTAGQVVTAILAGTVDMPGDTDKTVAEALSAAWAQGAGKWAISGTTLTIYAPDGTTAVATFTLDDADAPTSRTPA